MIETGTVIEAGEGAVTIRMQGSAKCEGCGHCSGTNTGGLVLPDVRDGLGARPGDTVEVEMPERGTIVAGMVYLLPVAGLIAGYALGWAVGNALGANADGVGAVFALAGAGTGLAGMRRIGRSVLAGENCGPRVRAIIARGHDRLPA